MIHVRVVIIQKTDVIAKIDVDIESSIIYGSIVMKIKFCELNPAIKRRIKNKAVEIGKKFYSVWSYTNQDGDEYLFARFGKIKSDYTVVTIAIKNPCCNGGWEPLYS